MDQAHTAQSEEQTAPISTQAMRQIATEHKVIMWCVVLLLAPPAVLMVQVFTDPHGDASPLIAVWKVLWAVASIASAVVVFSLARRLSNASVAAALALLSFIPLVGLCVMLAVDRKAMKVLRENGYRVGLLGAKCAPTRTDQRV